MADLYDGPVIDAHHHLWSLAGDHYPWLIPGSGFGPEGMFDGLHHDYVLEDYRRDVVGQNVVASVHVEALWDPQDDPMEETRWLETLDKADNLAIRYVAGTPFATAETESILRRQAQFERVVAIRQTIAWNSDPTRTMRNEPNISRKPEWRAALPVLVELGLSLELLMYAWQSDEIVELAELHPDLRIIVDHIASPLYSTPEALTAWEKNLEQLAASDNIVIKISSVASYTEPTLKEVSYRVAQVAEAFGPDRCMVGSDFRSAAYLGLLSPRLTANTGRACAPTAMTISSRCSAAPRLRSIASTSTAFESA